MVAIVLPDDFFRAKSFKGGWQMAAQKPKTQTLRVYYIMSTFERVNLESIMKVDFTRVHDAHWNIERFHRAIKQVCNVERFQVRNENPIKNHICAIKAYVKLEFMRLNKEISCWYQVKKELYVKVIREYINASSKNDAVVNA